MAGALVACAPPAPAAFDDPDASAGAALARLRTSAAPGPRQDLARYLRFDPARLAHADAPAKAPSAQAPRPEVFGVGEALTPVRRFVDGAKFDDPNLAEELHRLAEGLLRVGFGAPRRYRGLADEGCRPVARGVDDVCRALRVARGGASVQSTHLALEGLLTKTQEAHYLLSSVHGALFKADAVLAEVEPAVNRLAEAPSSTGRAALCLLHLDRAARGNLKAAAAGLAQDRGDVKRAFGALKDAMGELDRTREGTWSKPANAVVMDDAEGTLERVYRAARAAAQALAEIERRGPALEELFKVSYRGTVASVTALTASVPPGRPALDAQRDAAETCATWNLRIRALLTDLEREHGKLEGWASAIDGKRPQPLEIEFPPAWLLLEKAEMRTGATQPGATQPVSASAIPAVSRQSPLCLTPSDQTPGAAAPALDGYTPPRSVEAESALERDLRMLDELESLLRPGTSATAALANPTTADMLGARARRMD